MTVTLPVITKLWSQVHFILFLATEVVKISLYTKDDDLISEVSRYIEGGGVIKFEHNMDDLRVDQ